MIRPPSTPSTGITKLGFANLQVCDSVMDSVCLCKNEGTNLEELPTFLDPSVAHVSLDDAIGVDALQDAPARPGVHLGKRITQRSLPYGTHRKTGSVVVHVNEQEKNAGYIPQGCYAHEACAWIHNCPGLLTAT